MERGGPGQQMSQLTNERMIPIASLNYIVSNLILIRESLNITNVSWMSAKFVFLQARPGNYLSFSFPPRPVQCGLSKYEFKMAFVTHVVANGRVSCALVARSPLDG